MVNVGMKTTDSRIRLSFFNCLQSLLKLPADQKEHIKKYEEIVRRIFGNLKSIERFPEERGTSEQEVVDFVIK